MDDDSSSPNQTKKQKTNDPNNNNSKQELNYNNHITPTISVTKSTNNPPKFLVATSTAANKSLLKLNPFQLANAIDAVTGSKIINVTKLNNGYILLETRKEKQSITLQRIEFLDSIPVQIFPHNSINFSKVVIKTPALDNCSLVEIIGNLFSAGVINRRRITIL